MTPTRSESNYSIQSNGSVPGHSSHKSKRQECQPRGEAQMEDSRTSTSFQRPKSLSTGNNGDIPVSVQELVYVSKTARVGTSPKSLGRHHKLLSSSEEIHGARKTEELLKCWTPMSCKVQVKQMQAGLKNQSMLSEDQKKNLAQGKENSPVEAPQASTSKNTPQQVPNKPKKTPKNNKKGKEKEKGKAKPKWNKPYQQNYRIPKKEETAMDNVFNMARALMEFKNKEEEILSQ
ncbi:hypothetical protein O181_063602 [Austropuccinia psidii MF-1]|uniref:Uncharacterized protein n=1 Tax=Austropuccinia psidii MF-1 TaxID=1389203 RepID=A0A9Q3I1I9_9BASI|nr:hypothetical protein [Austropuccinia psidii MF-1]